MKKDIEWLKKEIGTEMIELEYKRAEKWSDVKYQALRSVSQKLDQLDESEVLSPEWVEDNTFVVTDEDGDDYAVVENRKLKDKLVSKQELPVIPRYVADFIEARKHVFINTLQHVFHRAMENRVSELFEEEYDWVRHHSETFARAWLDGYTVADEPLYYVINNQNYFLLAKDKGHGFVFSTGGNSKLGNTDNISATFKLTEQEIKDYDERYMAFAIPVENDK